MKRSLRKIGNAYYEYNNANPSDKYVGDCVIRAIAIANNIDWYGTYAQLCDIGIKNCVMPNSDKAYEIYLERYGWEKQKQPRKLDGKKYTVREFIQNIADSNKTYVVTVANHMTVVKNGKVNDTWDCSFKTVCNYWTK